MHMFAFSGCNFEKCFSPIYASTLLKHLFKIPSNFLPVMCEVSSLPYILTITCVLNEFDILLVILFVIGITVGVIPAFIIIFKSSIVSSNLRFFLPVF